MDIKKLRLAKGLTQMQVAKAVGVSLTALRVWEGGASNPTPENLEKLKEVLGVDEPLPFTEE